MKNIYKILFGSLLLFTAACDSDLDQFPEKQASSDSLTDFTGVLNAAYFYQQGAATPMAVMGDFRADNMQMIEAPYTDFDAFNSDIKSMEDQFFAPFYRNLYKSILSANTVILNSSNSFQIAEAKFLRALSYFKLVQVFGDVTINLSDAPSITDESVLVRRPASEVYNDVIIPDLIEAIADLDNSEIETGRASQLAAKSLLGKVYIFSNDFSSAAALLGQVIGEATAAGVTLEGSFANVVTDESSETIFATIKSINIDISDIYDFSEFTEWFSGVEDKAQPPLDPDLIAAFDAAGDVVRKELTIDETALSGVKYTGGFENDWIELRLSDVILLYAEALNENGSSAADALGELDEIRTRAGLATLVGTATTKDDVRDAILNERRLELAFEGHRWFDLVRTGTVEEEMGQTIGSEFYVFPIPNSEILATNGVITQNEGYN